MVRWFCAILLTVLQVVLLSAAAGDQPASRAIIAGVVLGDLAWYLFGELFLN